MSFKYRNGVLSGTLDPFYVPNAPNYVSASIAGSSAIIVNFTKPDSDGGGDILSYNAVVLPDKTQVDLGPISLDFDSGTITGLTPESSYYFQVWATNAFGQGPALNSNTVQLPATGDRGLFAGGGTGASTTNVIQYITIGTTGNTIDFGDLSVALNSFSACSTTSRAVFGGGIFTGGTYSSDIYYVEFQTLGNSVSFGNLGSNTRASNASSNSNSGVGVFAGGLSTGTTAVSAQTQLSIPILSNSSSSFGSLTLARSQLAGCSSGTRGIWAGGRATAAGASSNIIDYITFSNLGAAVDFGDLTAATSRLASCSSSTRGLFAGGWTTSTTTLTNVISYITIASVGNAIDFGDLSAVRDAAAACSNTTRAVFGGGTSDGTTAVNIVEYVTIGTLGNATDFGDLLSAIQSMAACASSNAANL